MILDEIYYNNNDPKWMKKITQKCVIFLRVGCFLVMSYPFGHFPAIFHGFLGKSGKFSKFSDFPPTSAGSKIYLYLSDDKIFGCSEKL